MRLPIQRKLFLSHFLAVLLVSGSIGTYFYLSAMDSLMASLQRRLKGSAAFIGQALDARDVDPVQSPEDINLPVYDDYLDRLRTFKDTNHDISYLYIMRIQGEKVVFVIDSDDSEAQALPGREYRWRVPALLKGFSEPAADERLYDDEWGSFMSGYAPIRNGGGTYLVGIDMRADEVSRKVHALRISGIISLIGSVLLAILFARILSQHFNRKIRFLTDQCGAMATGHLDGHISYRQGDELDTLTEAFSRMADQLTTSLDENQKARISLEKAKDELELKVAERTADLQNLNDQLRREIEERKILTGLLPICASCKKIRDDKGYWSQIENYLTAHSIADFSHGICPDCARKLYAQIEGLGHGSNPAVDKSQLTG
ncbi:MAG TPA: methyl-accepting chemotaxis protein [Thermodesulfobacteriota bacterium]|mgnify:CR=1 FL=1|nr:methyl-accepting chemotaxis protein [Thermodesulfobacteriota bacterium]